MKLIQKLFVIDKLVLRYFTRFTSWTEMKWGKGKTFWSSLGLFFSLVFITLGHGSAVASFYSMNQKLLAGLFALMGCAGLVCLWTMVNSLRFKTGALEEFSRVGDYKNTKGVAVLGGLVVTFFTVLFFDTGAISFFWYACATVATVLQAYFMGIGAVEKR